MIMDTNQALEMARCVKANLENMVKMMPVLASHPLLPIVNIQIDKCIAALDDEEKGE